MFLALQGETKGKNLILRTVILLIDRLPIGFTPSRRARLNDTGMSDLQGGPFGRVPVGGVKRPFPLKGTSKAGLCTR